MGSLHPLGSSTGHGWKMSHFVLKNNCVSKIKTSHFSYGTTPATWWRRLPITNQIGKMIQLCHLAKLFCCKNCLLTNFKSVDRLFHHLSIKWKFSSLQSRSRGIRWNLRRLLHYKELLFVPRAVLSLSWPKAIFFVKFHESSDLRLSNCSNCSRSKQTHREKTSDHQGSLITGSNLDHGHSGTRYSPDSPDEW